MTRAANLASLQKFGSSGANVGVVGGGRLLHMAFPLINSSLHCCNCAAVAIAVAIIVNALPPLVYQLGLLPMDGHNLLVVVVVVIIIVVGRQRRLGG